MAADTPIAHTQDSLGPGLSSSAFLKAYGRLVERLFAKAEAARWNLAQDRFAQALYRSAECHFRDKDATPAQMKAYLESLHVGDLAMAIACSDGQEQAWEQFVRDYRPILYAAARAIVGAGNEAQTRELADSIYAELYGLGARAGQRKSLFDYFHGRSKLSTWLRAVLAQKHVDALRARRQTEPLEDEHAGAAAGTPLGREAASSLPPDPERARYLTLLQAALLEALAGLHPRERLRLAYYYVQGLTLKEIGRILGEHEASVSRHLDRTRKDLRKRVEATLRAGRGRAGTREGARSGLSDAQVRLCFEYALEEWPYDLSRALCAQAPEAKP